MKKQIYILLLLASVTTYAQDTIISIKAKNYPRTTNAYYKDIDNDLNPFEGTWIYTNGNVEFKIVLLKKMQQFNGEYYEDLIIGEYEHKVNGIVVNSSLDQLNTVYNNQRRHEIDSNFLVDKNYRRYRCPDCGANELRLNASLMDKNTDCFAIFVLRKVLIGNQQALETKIFYASHPQIYGAPGFSLPLGELTFYKQ